MPGEFFTFDEVLQELKIEEEEFRRLISQGEIRAYRDASGLKFKREDVERLKKAHETEPTIILTDSDAEITIPSEEEMVVEEGEKGKETALDIGVYETEEMPTVIKPPRAQEAPKKPAARPPVEPAPSAVSREAEREEEEFETITPTRVGSGRISRSARLRLLQMKRKKSHIIWTVLLFITTIIILTSGPFVFNEMRSVTPQYAVDLSDKVRGLADWFFSLSKD